MVKVFAVCDKIIYYVYVYLSSRIFYPGIATGLGVDMANSMDVAFYRGEILKSVEIVQSHQLVSIARRKNLLPFA